MWVLREIKYKHMNVKNKTKQTRHKHETYVKHARRITKRKKKRKSNIWIRKHKYEHIRQNTWCARGERMVSAWWARGEQGVDGAMTIDGAVGKARLREKPILMRDAHEVKNRHARNISDIWNQQKSYWATEIILGNRNHIGHGYWWEGTPKLTQRRSNWWWKQTDTYQTKNRCWEPYSEQKTYSRGIFHYRWIFFFSIFGPTTRGNEDPQEYAIWNFGWLQAIWKPVVWVYPGLNGQKLQPWLLSVSLNNR